MNLLFISKGAGCKCSVDLAQAKFYIPLFFLLIGLCGGLVYGGYRIAGVTQPADARPLVQEEWVKDMERQRREVSAARSQAEENVNALALRLGQLQAHVIRLDALGKRLVKMAELDGGEFDFDDPPAQGGAGPVSDQQPLAVPDFLATLDEVSRQLSDRERQLNLLSAFLMNSNLQEEVLPAGRPVKKGWISSYFGKRTDPFTGKIGYHEGIDFAGKLGSEVIAVASGVVSYAGRRSKYGNTVEISHGNGYVTRYAHNQKILVKVGDTVKKGETVAKMGSSGRSTGPHVHFEVIVQGKVVNPLRYIRADAK
ncbi:M23 family metallopeptidase [Endothiovibrio diazotrophicus]